MWLLFITLAGAAETDCLLETCTDADATPAPTPQSVTGAPLQTCGTEPLTGWFRDGSCRTDAQDRGVHTVCAVVDDAFLSYTRTRGNDLSTPRGSFPGLRPGDRWCLCASRWDEARRAGHAPPVVLEATDDASLRIVSLTTLQSHAWGAVP